MTEKTDKRLIKTRFAANYATYCENARAQKIAVKKLAEFLESDYSRVLEIGCGTGLLTRELSKSNIKELFLNDLCPESETYTKKLATAKSTTFLNGDAEVISLPENLDLIISSGTFQWFEDIEAFLQKCKISLKTGKKLVFSTYTKGNYNEINHAFNASLNYKSHKRLHEIASKHYEVRVSESEKIVLYFDNLQSLLKHIKLTGTNAVKSFKLTKTGLKEAEQKYEKLRTAQGLPLTYAASYFVLEKN